MYNPSFLFLTLCLNLHVDCVPFMISGHMIMGLFLDFAFTHLFQVKITRMKSNPWMKYAYFLKCIMIIFICIVCYESKDILPKWWIPVDELGITPSYISSGGPYDTRLCQRQLHFLKPQALLCVSVVSRDSNPLPQGEQSGIVSPSSVVSTKYCKDFRKFFAKNVPNFGKPIQLLFTNFDNISRKWP